MHSFEGDHRSEAGGGLHGRDAAERVGAAGGRQRARLAIFGQPVFAGVYLSGDYDALRWHAVNADVVTSVGYVQLVVAIVA